MGSSSYSDLNGEVWRSHEKTNTRFQLCGLRLPDPALVSQLADRTLWQTMVVQA